MVQNENLNFSTTKMAAVLILTAQCMTVDTHFCNMLIVCNNSIKLTTCNKSVACWAV